MFPPIPDGYWRPRLAEPSQAFAAPHAITDRAPCRDAVQCFRPSRSQALQSEYVASPDSPGVKPPPKFQPNAASAAKAKRLAEMEVGTVFQRPRGHSPGHQ